MAVTGAAPTFADLEPFTCRDMFVATRGNPDAGLACEWSQQGERLARLDDPYHSVARFVMGGTAEDPEQLRVCAVCVLKIRDRRVLGRIGTWPPA